MQASHRRYRRSSSIPWNLLLTIAVIFVSGIGLVPGAAMALDIHGRVTNGTTGEPVGPITVSIVDPRHGMATEGEIKTDAQGNFTAEGLDDKTSIYLLQVNYKGVTYTEMARPSGEERLHVAINVYETTPSWEDVRLSIPHLMFRRSHDTLSVDRVFMIANNTDPPKTLSGEHAGFKIYLPEERLRITSLFVTSLGIPISMTPQPTGTPHIYTIDYPFKPGQTRVGASFDVDYANERYTYEERLQYDIDEIIVMTADPTMEIGSESVDLGEAEEVRGFNAYVVDSLAEGTTLALAVRGGEPHIHTADRQTSGRQVVPLRGPLDGIAIVLIFGFTLLLVLLMVFATRSPIEGTEPVALLTSRKNSLLDQIAKLDDLFETGTVSDRLYKDKRSELVDNLARIIYQIDNTQPKTHKAGRRKKGETHAR